MNSPKPQPFSTFGQALKQLRQKSSETQAEVSGAVEVELSSLRSYEQGESRPSEEVLLLLIQHFSLPEDQASELWRLAGYGSLPENEMQLFMNNDTPYHEISPLPLMGPDSRVVYTDMVQVMVNNFGVIINFMQGSGSGNSPLAVARVGMSREHAKSVIDVLKTTLDQATALENKAKVQRQLPPPVSKKKKEQ